ncbi:hypothetical protein GCM10008941_08740 [Rhizomicrobium palustre]
MRAVIVRVANFTGLFSGALMTEALPVILSRARSSSTALGGGPTGVVGGATASVGSGAGVSADGAAAGGETA